MTADNHAEHTVVKAGSDRSFGIVFAVVFAIIGLWPLLWGEGARWWALAVAAAFLAVALARPGLLAPLNRLWFRFGMLLNRVVSPLIMGLMFVLVITPTALVFRLRGKDPLRLRRKPEATTYWLPREHDKAGTMANQF